MIEIKPFRAYRPEEDYVSRVAALPYDVVDNEETKRLIRNNPYSFLNVDKPEAYAQKMPQKTCYEIAGQYLQYLMKKGILIQEDTPCLYIYGLESVYTNQYGIVGCLSCQDYEDGKIKKHENTREDKEAERILHVASCKAHTGPIFLACKEEDVLKQLIEEQMKQQQPLYEFSQDGIRQIVYRISGKQEIHKIAECFKELDALYVADGHHRLKAAVTYAKQQKEAGTSDEDTAEYNHFLGVVFPKSYLRIMDYNRVIKDESGLSQSELMNALAQDFEVTPIEGESYKPYKQHVIGMSYKKQWYQLALKENRIKELDVVARLDTSILQSFILEPIFKIKDPRTDKRIDFVSGIKGIEGLNEQMEQGMDIAFTLYPVDVDELIAVADAQELMPPKSTWFEPKLRSGLFIHVF